MNIQTLGMCETAAHSVNNRLEFHKKAQSIYEKKESFFHEQKESKQNKTESPYGRS